MTVNSWFKLTSTRLRLLRQVENGGIRRAKIHSYTPADRRVTGAMGELERAGLVRLSYWYPARPGWVLTTAGMEALGLIEPAGDVQ